MLLDAGVLEDFPGIWKLLCISELSSSTISCEESSKSLLTFLVCSPRVPLPLVFLCDVRILVRMLLEIDSTVPWFLE